jgi:hypothetical protein
MRTRRAKIGVRLSIRFGPFPSQSGKLFRETIGGVFCATSELLGTAPAPGCAGSSRDKRKPRNQGASLLLPRSGHRN